MLPRVIIILILSTGICNSCQKKFEAPQGDSLAVFSPEFTAKIGETPFVAVLSGAVRRSDGVISIAAKSVEGKILAFTLVDSGVHVYTLDMRSASNFCGYEDDTGLAFSSNEGINPGDSGGNVEITSIDSIKRTMSGNFNLKVFREISRSQRVITEGIFNNIPY